MKSIFLVAVLSMLYARGSAQSGLVVIELFTSQGCSSCPSADVLLSKVVTDAFQKRRCSFVQTDDMKIVAATSYSF